MEVAAGVLCPFIGSGRRCGERPAAAGVHYQGTSYSKGDDGAAMLHGEIEEEATTHLFLFPLGTGGRQMEARGAAARRSAVAAAGRAGGRRRPGWSGWAELPGNMGLFQREVARATRRNGPKF
jgi:hypothetical protein